MVWRTPKETFDPQCIAPKIKHGGDVLHEEETESCIFLIEQWTGSFTARC